MKTKQISSPLVPLNHFALTKDASAPKADITNAPHLFGDPYDLGDPDDYGDPSDYGDPDALGTFDLISGDPDDDDDEEWGEPGKLKRFISKYKTPLAGAAGLAAGVAGTRLVQKTISRRRAKRAAVDNRIAAAARRNTLLSQSLVKRNIGGIDLKGSQLFQSLKGGKLNSSPIDPGSTFINDMFKNMLDRQNMDTPFYQETAIGTFGGGTWTAQANGVATPRLFTGLILQMGTNILNAAPGTVITVTATIPTFAGPLTVAANPWIITYEKQFDVRFLFFPWQLVANKPMPVLGQYDNANPIIVTVNGLPAASAVNLIVPGSLHPWTVAMRTALIR